MSRYVLIDCMNPVVSEDDFPVLHLDSEDQLRGALAGFRARRPSIVQMRNTDGDILIIAVGEPFGALKWMRVGDRHFLKIALADQLLSEHGIEFREQGTDAGFRSKYLIPIEKVIEAVASFYSAGKVPDWVRWSSWNPESNRMEPDPPRTMA